MKRILLFGATGQIGGELTPLLPALGEPITPSRREADFRDPIALQAFVLRLRPEVIINAAAYTNVDEAERNREEAFAVNAAAPGALGKAAAECGALLVHYSTDYVFDGHASRPYRETDHAKPLNVYGESKRAGGQAAMEAGGRALVFRTGWIYGLRGKNFLRAIQRQAALGGPLRVVHDQIGAPTWSRCVAEGTVEALRRVLDGSCDERGVFHMTCSGAATRFDFARSIVQGRVPVEAVDTGHVPRPAVRPAFSVLDNHRMNTLFHVRLPSWEKALCACLAEDRTPSAP